MTTPPRAISGRWFTLGFVAILILGVAMGFLSVVRFQKIMSSLDQVRQIWPMAAVALNDRYEKLDRLIQASNSADAGSVLVDRVEWQKTRGAYAASTQYDVQVRLVRRLESMYAQQFPAKNFPVESKTQPDSIRHFIEADRTLDRLQSDSLGWLCMQLYRLNIPGPVYSFLE